MSTFRKITYLFRTLAISVPFATIATIQLTKSYPHLFYDEEALERMNGIRWIDLLDGKEPESEKQQKKLQHRCDATAVGIQQTHFWTFVVVPDDINTAFVRLNDKEVLMYNIGPLTDQVQRFLREERIEKVHHIMCCNGEMEKYLRDWIRKVEKSREGGQEGDSTQKSSDEAPLPEVIHYQFTTLGEPMWRLQDKDKKHIRQIVSFSQLPPILRDNFKFAKVEASPLIEEVVMLHHKTKTLFTTFLTRYYTDLYKNTPSYNWIKLFKSKDLNHLTTSYSPNLVLDKIEFRNFVNEVSDWQFENVFMVQGELIKGGKEMPQRWRDAFNEYCGERYDEDEKI